MTNRDNLQLPNLLLSIKFCLQQAAISQNSASPFLKQSIQTLTEKLQPFPSNPQQRLEMIIGDDETQERLRNVLEFYFEQHLSGERLNQLCSEAANSVRDPVPIYASSLSALIQEVIDNIDIIALELTDIRTRLLAVSTPHPPAHHLPLHSLFALFQLATQDQSPPLPECLDTLLSQLDLLQQSLELILLKTAQVLPALSEIPTDSEPTHRSSMRSDNSCKKSALSQSLHIFLQKQRAQSHHSQPQPNFRLIESEFKACGPAERKAVAAKTPCCFLF